MFLTRDVEWRNRIVSAFREAGLPEGKEQWRLLAMSAFDPLAELKKAQSSAFDCHSRKSYRQAVTEL